jgi:hypothetical protein
VLLDKSLYEQKVHDIHKTNVILTMVDGKVVHDAIFGVGDVNATGYAISACFGRTIRF